MPTLNWIGKEAVVKHRKDVPFRLLEPVPELSLSSPRGSEGDFGGNLIVQGDNLHALKALLPRYAGQVKCIYIDPPYNTGNEGWVYNDNVNSPEIRKWLGEVVGKEGETLDRHDRWLCMMYPRLVLLKQFLREDGAIFVSIDDNEVATLRLLMDEIFEARNFVATVIWQKKYAVANDHKTIAPMHDFVLVYQRSPKWQRNLLPRGNEKDSQYKYEDEKGVFRPDNYTCNKTAEERPNLYYPVTNPNTGEEIWPKRTRVWAYSQEEHQRHIADGLIYWGKDGKAAPPFALPEAGTDYVSAALHYHERWKARTLVELLARARGAQWRAPIDPRTLDEERTLLGKQASALEAQAQPDGNPEEKKQRLLDATRALGQTGQDRTIAPHLHFSVLVPWDGEAGRKRTVPFELKGPSGKCAAIKEADRL